MSHTKGPWITYDSRASGWWVYAPNGIKNECPEGQAVANCGVTSLSVSREELDANARLIAAAPEMLDLLKRLQVWICIDERASDCNVTWDECFALIAKAEGKAQ